MATTGSSTSSVISPRRILAAVIVVLVVAFVLQNREPANVQLFGIIVSMPLWLVLTVMTALGAAVGFLLARRR